MGTGDSEGCKSVLRLHDDLSDREEHTASLRRGHRNKFIAVSGTLAHFFCRPAPVVRSELHLISPSSSDKTLRIIYPTFIINSCIAVSVIQGLGV